MSEIRSDILIFWKVFRKADFSGKLALVLAAWFGTGLLPKAPGTFGALAALPLVLAMSYLKHLSAVLFLVGFVLLAIWASGISGRILGRDDPHEVVIDEVAGFLLTLCLLPPTGLTLSMGFVLFRFFDIAKPFPIKRLEKMRGGWGIVLDDLMAGIYAHLCLRILFLFL